MLQPDSLQPNHQRTLGIHRFSALRQAVKYFRMPWPAARNPIPRKPCLQTKFAIACSVVLTAPLVSAQDESLARQLAPSPGTRSVSSQAPTRVVPLRQVFRGRFLIGSAVPPLNHYNPGELQLLKKHFGTITPENCMKPVFLQPEEGRFDFATADSLVDQARGGGLTVNGHTLVWHAQTPEWMFRDGEKPAGRELLLARMRAHIAAVAGHFAGRLNSWDVVNEAIDDGGGFLRPSPWLAGIGPDFIAEAFVAAHKAAPDATLYYNDYGIETTTKMEKTLRLIRELKARNAPIHGVGIQGHYQLDRIPFDQIERAIMAYHAEGLEVAITELDIDVATRTTDGADISQTESAGEDRFASGLPDDVQTRLADQYAALFALYLKHQDKIKRVTFWGLHDGCSWLNHFPSKRTNHPLLWDRNLQPKPAFFRVLESSGHPNGPQPIKHP